MVEIFAALDLLYMVFRYEGSSYVSLREEVKSFLV